jgi:putative transposase
MYDFRRMTVAERREILCQRWARGFPLHAPPHFHGVAGEYLITAACYEHRPVFDTPEVLSYLTKEALESFQCSRPSLYCLGFSAESLSCAAGRL